MKGASSHRSKWHAHEQRSSDDGRVVHLEKGPHLGSLELIVTAMLLLVREELAPAEAPLGGAGARYRSPP